MCNFYTYINTIKGFLRLLRKRCFRSVFNKHIAVLFFQKGKYTGSYKALGQIESLVTNSMDITFIKTLWAKTHSVFSHLNVFGPHFNTQLGHRIIFVTPRSLGWLRALTRLLVTSTWVVAWQRSGESWPWPRPALKHPVVQENLFSFFKKQYFLAPTRSSRKEEAQERLMSLSELVS